MNLDQIELKFGLHSYY